MKSKTLHLTLAVLGASVVWAGQTQPTSGVTQSEKTPQFDHVPAKPHDPDKILPPPPPPPDDVLKPASQSKQALAPDKASQTPSTTIESKVGLGATTALLNSSYQFNAESNKTVLTFASDGKVTGNPTLQPDAAARFVLSNMHSFGKSAYVDLVRLLKQIKSGSSQDAATAALVDELKKKWADDLAREPSELPGNSSNQFTDYVTLGEQDEFQRASNVFKVASFGESGLVIEGRQPYAPPPGLKIPGAVAGPEKASVWREFYRARGDKIILEKVETGRIKPAQAETVEWESTAPKK